MLHVRLITTLLMTSLTAGCAGTHGTRYVGHEVCQAPQAQPQGSYQDPHVLTDQYFPQPAEPSTVRPAPVPPAQIHNNNPIPSAPSMDEEIPLPPMTTSYEAPDNRLEPVKQTPILLRPIGIKNYGRIGGHSLRTSH